MGDETDFSAEMYYDDKVVKSNSNVWVIHQRLRNHIWSLYTKFHSLMKNKCVNSLLKQQISIWNCWKYF